MAHAKIEQHRFELNMAIPNDAALHKHLRSMAKTSQKTEWIKRSLNMVLQLELTADKFARDPETPEEYRRAFIGTMTTKQSPEYSIPAGYEYSDGHVDEPHYEPPEDIA